MPGRRSRPGLEPSGMSVPFPSPAGVPITGQAVPGVKAA